MPGHLDLYWYRQTLGKGMEFLMSIYNKEPSEKAHFMEDCFSAELPDGAYLILKMQPAQLGDLAMFLCASSLPTALQRCFLPFHKLHSVSMPCSSLQWVGVGVWDAETAFQFAQVKISFNLQKKKCCIGHLGLWYSGKAPRHHRIWPWPPAMAPTWLMSDLESLQGNLCILFRSLCVIPYFAKHAFLLSLSGDWLTGEERGELQGNIQEPPTGNFPEDKGSQQQS